MRSSPGRAMSDLTFQVPGLIELNFQGPLKRGWIKVAFSCSNLSVNKRNHRHA
jgi:hypothetical protein